MENWNEVTWLQIRSPVNRVMNILATNMLISFVNN